MSNYKQRYTAKQVAEALVATRGMVYIAAERLGCDPRTVYNYMERYSIVREAQESANGRALDMSETMLMKRIMSGDITAIKYHLSTKGKHRGYTMEVEVGVTHRMDQEISEARDKLSDILAITGDRLKNASLNGHSEDH